MEIAPDPGRERVLKSVLIFFLCCFSLTEMLFYGVPGMDRVSVVANFGMSLCSVISLPMMTLFLLHCSGESWQKSLLFHIVLAQFVIFFILLIIAQFTSAINCTESGNLRALQY